MAANAYLLGLIALALSGYFHWVWWIPAMIALGSVAAYEFGTGFRTVALAQTEGTGFLIRYIIMAALLFLLVWSIGYGLSFVL